MLQAQSEPRRETSGCGFAAITLEQELLKRPRIDHGRIADGVHARGDGAVDLPERDLVAENDRGLEAGAAGALQIEPGRFRRQPAAEHGLARQIPLARMLHDRAGGNLVHALALQAVALDHTAQRRGEHLLVADLCVRAVAACERNAYAADDGDTPRICSDQHTYTSSGATRIPKLRIMNPPAGI